MRAMCVEFRTGALPAFVVARWRRNLTVRAYNPAPDVPATQRNRLLERIIIVEPYAWGRND